MPPVLDDLLQKTSRTFALTIPLLREPTRREVGVAYLLFRVADTIEDATAWPRQKKVQELHDLALFLEETPDDLLDSSANLLVARWSFPPPVEHAGYRELLASFRYVASAARGLPFKARGIIVAHTARTCRAMAEFVAREGQGGGIRLHSIEDLRLYCYAVAGIVGEMLTELFLLNDPRLEPIAPELRRAASTFGEALQLVNILKDVAADVVEGRTYLPPAASRAEIFGLARRDLVIAAQYCTALERADADEGLVGFTALPVLLAKATLDRVQEQGSAAKVDRSRVLTIVEELKDALRKREVGDLLDRTLASIPAR